MNLWTLIFVTKLKINKPYEIMWQRLIRLLATGFNVYSFYSNPVRFIVSILCVILIPYLAYIFWGALIIVALIMLGVFLIYKAIQTSSKNSANYH